jgi:hypothetical protein
VNGCLSWTGRQRAQRACYSTHILEPPSPLTWAATQGCALNPYSVALLNGCNLRSVSNSGARFHGLAGSSSSCSAWLLS